MYEARQNKEKVSRQIEKSYNYSLQYKSKKVLQCTDKGLHARTTIYTNQNRYDGEGNNNGTDKDSVCETIKGREETFRIGDLPQQDNPMGACAEPHALANALDAIPKEEKILSVLQYPALATKDEKINGVFYKKGAVVPGCRTCKQWANGIGDNGQPESYVKIHIDKSMEKREKLMKKFGKRNRQLGVDFKKGMRFLD